MKQLHLAFAGTPTFAATILDRLIKTTDPIDWVLTQPDRPKGRGRVLSLSPVKALASDYNIPVIQVERLPFKWSSSC